MKLFQIEEPDGAPLDGASGPGLAIGIDLSGREAVVAVALGGNAEVLPAPEGAAGPPIAGLFDVTGRLATAPLAGALAALRLRAERALARPVTHAVILAPSPVTDADRAVLGAAAAASGLTLTRILAPAEAAALAAGAAGSAGALGAAIAAEDDAARLLPPP